MTLPAFCHVLLPALVALAVAFPWPLAALLWVPNPYALGLERGFRQREYIAKMKQDGL